MSSVSSPRPDEVLRAVIEGFPDETPSAIMEILAQYGVERHERERERVQLAIVAPVVPRPIQVKGSIAMSMPKPAALRGLDGPSTGRNRNGPSGTFQLARVRAKSASWFG